MALLRAALKQAGKRPLLEFTAAGPAAIVESVCVAEVVQSPQDAVLLRLEREGETARLALERGPQGGMWPVFEVQEEFVRRLAHRHSGKWQVAVLHVEEEESCWAAWRVVGREHFDLERVAVLSQREAMERQAMMLMRKLWPRGGLGRGLGRGRSHRRRRRACRAAMGGEDVEEEEEEEGHEREEEEEDEEDEVGGSGEVFGGDRGRGLTRSEGLPVAGPAGSLTRSEGLPVAPAAGSGHGRGLGRQRGPGAVAPAGRGDRAEAWGPFELATIYRQGVMVGCGATCGRHLDDVRKTDDPCKKQVTFGKGGELDEPTLKLRLKRWLVAGLLEEHKWGTEQRSSHVLLGGQHLRQFAEGLEEEVLDEIVRTVV